MMCLHQVHSNTHVPLDSKTGEQGNEGNSQCFRGLQMGNLLPLIFSGEQISGPLTLGLV